MAQPSVGIVLAPDDPAEAAARAVVRFHLRTFAREAVGARAGAVEPVHQLRVATRRLRAALELFAPILPARFAAEARADLAALGRAIGAVRDLDVLALAVAARGRRLAPELRAGLGPLEQALAARRAAAHDAMLEALDSARGRAVVAALTTFARGAPAARGVALGALAPALVQPVVRALVRAGRRIDDRSPPEAVHRVRVRAKRLRYALETLRGLGGRRLARVLRRLERLQELLGEYQDAVTQAAWLRRWSEEADAPPPRALRPRLATARPPAARARASPRQARARDAAPRREVGVTVYLVRHGIAEDAPPSGDYRARRLTARGKAKMREAAAGLAALGVEPDVILTSPLPRAAETAAIVAKALGGRLEPEPLDALATGVTAPEVLRALRPFARHASVMLVGHEPTLSALAALLLTGSTEGAAFALRKGGVIALEVEQLLPPRGAMLVWMLTPRQLRRLAS